MKRNRSLWLAALLAVMLFSCQKELAEDLVATESEQIAEARAALKTPEEVNFFDLSHASSANLTGCSLGCRSFSGVWRSHC